MNFIPSKHGHEEYKDLNQGQGKGSFQTYQTLAIMSSIRGDDDQNDGHVSDEELERQEQSLANKKSSISAGLVPPPYVSFHQLNSHSQQSAASVSSNTLPQRFHHHSMKENVHSKTTTGHTNSMSPFLTSNKKQPSGLINLTFGNKYTAQSFDKSIQELNTQILSQRQENEQMLSDPHYQPQNPLFGHSDLKDLQSKKQGDIKAQDQFFNRLNKEAELHQETRQQLTEKQKRKEMQECTFTPQMNSNRADEQRSLQKFLDDQQRFQKNQSNKINLLRYQMQEEKNLTSTHQPRINAKSEMIVQQKRTEKEAVHDRLYKIAKDKREDNSKIAQASFATNQKGLNQIARQSEYEIQLEQQNTFIPQINEKSKLMMRKGKVGDHLYQDALRRQEKTQPQSENAPLKQRQSMGNNVKIVSNKTEQMVAIKFVRDFEHVCDEIFSEPLSQMIDYLQIGEILRRLNFLKYSGVSHNQDNLSNMGVEGRIVYDIWYNLHGDELGGVSKCNLCQFLLIVIGIFGFQLQTEEQLREWGEYKNSRQTSAYQSGNVNNSYNNTNIANPLSNEQIYIGNQQRLQMHEGRVEEDEREYAEDTDEYFPNQAHRQEQYDSEQNVSFNKQLHSFNQQGDAFSERLNEFHSQNKPRRGYIDAIGNWVIPAEEAKSLQKEFETLYRNRLSGEELKKTIFHQENSYQPTILPSSKRLAEQYREKLLEETATLIENQEIQVKVPASGKITHVDLLVFQKQAQMNERIKKNINQKLSQEQNCTFHPQTLQSSSSMISKSQITHDSSSLATDLHPSLSNKVNQNPNNNSRNQVNTSTTFNNGGVKKCLQLYELAKHKGPRKDRNKNEIDYERDLEECTFQPDFGINRSKSFNTLRKSNVTQNSTQSLLAKDADKAVDRMRTANKHREEKNIMLQRGYTLFSDATQEKRKISKTPPISTRLYNDTPLHRIQKINEEKQNQNTQKEEQDIYEDFPLEVNQQKQYKNPKDDTTQVIHYENPQYTDANGHYSYDYDYAQQNDYQPQQQPEQQFNNKMSPDQFGQFQQINPLERVPLLFVDVNLGKEKAERIIVFEGDTSAQLAARFAEEHKLDEAMQQKLKELLDSQIACLLSKIEEEEAPSMMSD